MSLYDQNEKPIGDDCAGVVGMVLMVNNLGAEAPCHRKCARGAIRDPRCGSRARTRSLSASRLCAFLARMAMCDVPN